MRFRHLFGKANNLKRGRRQPFIVFLWQVRLPNGVCSRIHGLRQRTSRHPFVPKLCLYSAIYGLYLLHTKNETKILFYEVLNSFGCRIKTGSTNFDYFSRLTYVQPWNSKGLGESFPKTWLNVGLSWRIRELCLFWLFFKIDLCLATLFRRFQRELSIDVAKCRSIVKKKHLRPQFYFYPPKTRNKSLRHVFRVCVRIP